MYKVLPDAVIDWSDAVIGAVLTTVLFLGGKFVIGLYIEHSNVGGAYGPAGAFVVLLTWMYYSSLIVLMGAELTRGVADARGKPIRPSVHAVEIEAAPAEVGNVQRPAATAAARTGRRAVSRTVTPVGAAACLVGAGALAGAIVVGRLRRR
jgi:membrane protein